VKYQPVQGSQLFILKNAGKMAVLTRMLLNAESNQNIGFSRKSPFFVKNWQKLAKIGPNRRKSLSFLGLTPDR
jgi:hypothetical protein